jgi:Kdo2-lipid IVA lauroyltransferase/acyltransferase
VTVRPAVSSAAPRARPRRFSARLEPLVPVLAAGLSRLLGRLSWPGVQRLGRGLGLLAWTFGRRDRRRSLDHLALAFPELPEKARQALARDCFRHQGMNLAECLHLLHGDCADVSRHVEVRGWEEVERARASGRPLLIVTGHCGNWELLAAALNCRGLGMAVVARALDEPRLQGMLAGLRRRFGTATIERGSDGAARQMLGLLRRGEALGMLIDQDTKVDGVWVPFFGRPAFTPVGAAKIALRQATVVLPVFIERRPDGSHLARVLPALDLPEDPREATALMTRAIEEQVRRHPEQWVWMHRRWRRQPPGEGAAG